MIFLEKSKVRLFFLEKFSARGAHIGNEKWPAIYVLFQGKKIWEFVDIYDTAKFLRYKSNIFTA